MFRTGLNRGAQAVPLTERLPWAYFADQGIVFLKFGGFMRTLRFRGGDADSMSDSELDATMRRLHDALRRVRGQMSLHIEARRGLASAYPGADLSDEERRAQWPDPVSFLFDEERRDAYDRFGTHFETERYITFVWKCSKASTRRARALFVTGQSKAKGKQGSRELHEFLQASSTVKGMLDGVMKECSWLSDDDTFDYLHKTVSVNQHRVKPSFGKARIDYDVADCRVVGGMAPMLGNCHMRVISIKNSPDTVPAALAALDTLPFEHRYALRWMGMEHGEGLRRIEAQLRDWKMLGIAMIPMLISYMLKSDKQQENQAANAMAEDATEALYAARRDEMTIGQANINVVIWDKDLTALEAKVQIVTDIMNRQSLTVVSYGVASIDTWLGTLPGHIFADLRRPIRTSVNLAHFSPYSSVWSGDARNEHLTAKLKENASPLIIATTDGSTPFRVNLHTQGELGHTLIIGPSGNGKTTFINGIIASSRRYRRSKVCIFTIKGGGEIVTRLLGGVSYDVGSVNRGSLGFQPLAYADEPNERVDLLDWLLGLLIDQQVEINTEVRSELTKALDMIAANPLRRRTLTHLTAYVNSPEIKSALKHYTLDGGTYGRLLDDDEDRIALADVLNFDMTELLKKPSIAKHVLAHLFRYVERRIFTGEHVILVVDEAWRFLGDALFTAKFEEWLRAARSKNVVVVFATQNMKDGLDGTIGKVLGDAENVPNIILLPNERAKSEKGRRAYEQLGFHERDIEIVANAIPMRQYYFTCPKGRRLFDFNLGPLGRALCASTSTDDLNLAHKILAEHPSEFAPRFLEAKGLHEVVEFVRMETGHEIPDIAMAAE